jgi:hypothetical protein
MLVRTDALTNEVLEPITLVVAHPTVCMYLRIYVQVYTHKMRPCVAQHISTHVCIHHQGGHNTERLSFVTV